MMDNGVLDSEQEKLLDQALTIVKQEAFEMKRYLDKSLYVESFKHAAAMLSELRTSALSPKFYYRLYVDIVTELSHLSATLSHDSSGTENQLFKFNEFYEIVQYAGNIIPRLYLLISVGVVYFKIDGSPKKDILKDLVEMGRGVQHPIRGLFLRNFLITMTKELLPDSARGDDSNPAGDIDDAVGLIMDNFCEMNKLWVRMQHQGLSKDKEKREKERRELRILVGTNLVRLSQLENLTLEMYQDVVLPKVLEQAVSCKEPISQEYLMECVIQVFSDEFHLATLNEFLDACAGLDSEVKVKNIISVLIDRLTIYATAPNSPGIPDDIPLFEIFSRHCTNLIATRPEMPLEDIIVIQTALLSLASRCYPEKTEYFNLIFESISSLLRQKEVKSLAPNSNIGKELMKLIKIPIEQLNNVIRVLDITELGDLIKKFNYRGRCLISRTIVANILENETRLTNEEHVEGVLHLLDTLVVDSDDFPPDEHKSEDFKEEQELVSRVLLFIGNEDIEKNLVLLKIARKSFGCGGKYRLSYTLPPVVYRAYQLLHQYNAQRASIEDFDDKVQKIFIFAMKTIRALKTEADCSSLAYKLYLEGSLISDSTIFDNSMTVTYEYISKAISIYEEDIHDSKEQVRFVGLLTGTLQQMKRLSEENMDPLTSKCVIIAAKLLKKQDQARAVARLAHMFWFGPSEGHENGRQDGDRVAECLRKALKISSQCMDDLIQIQMFNHILNEFLFFYERGCTELNAEEMNKLIGKIRDSVYQLEKTPEAEPIIECFQRTMVYIKEKQDVTDAEPCARLQGIIIG